MSHEIKSLVELLELGAKLLFILYRFFLKFIDFCLLLSHHLFGRRIHGCDLLSNASFEAFALFYVLLEYGQLVLELVYLLLILVDDHLLVVNSTLEKLIFLAMDQILKLPSLTHCNSRFFEPLLILFLLQLFSLVVDLHCLSYKWFVWDFLLYIVQLTKHLLILCELLLLLCSIVCLVGILLLLILILFMILDNLKLLL